MPYWSLRGSHGAAHIHLLPDSYLGWQRKGSRLDRCTQVCPWGLSCIFLSISFLKSNSQMPFLHNTLEAATQTALIRQNQTVVKQTSAALHNGWRWKPPNASERMFERLPVISLNSLFLVILKQGHTAQHQWNAVTQGMNSKSQQKSKFSHTSAKLHTNVCLQVWSTWDSTE